MLQFDEKGFVFKENFSFNNAIFMKKNCTLDDEQNSEIESGTHQ